MHAFDEWFARVYPNAPSGIKDVALIAWNAAIHATVERVGLAKDQRVIDAEYESAVALRDLKDSLLELTRARD